MSIPQQHALRLHLAMIAGREPRTSYIEIRSRRRRGGMHQTFVLLFDLGRAERAIMNRGQVTDVYVGAAPRVRQAGAADAVERVWCLWIDCDTEASVERLRAFRPLPNLVIRSGTEYHRHAWWQLDAPLEPEHAVRANRRLARALSGDRGATDAARIMRPPSTLNWKHDPPTPVECTRLELEVHSVAAIVGHLPDDSAYTRPIRAMPSSARVVAPVSALAGLTRFVRESPVGERNQRLNWAAYRAGESLSIDPDEAETQLLSAAVEIGLPEPEALRTITSGLTAAARRAA